MRQTHRMTISRRALSLALPLLLALTACGGGAGGGAGDAGSDDGPQLTVLAAASLTDVFTELATRSRPTRARR